VRAFSGPGSVAQDASIVIAEKRIAFAGAPFRHDTFMRSNNAL